MRHVYTYIIYVLLLTSPPFIRLIRTSGRTCHAYPPSSSLPRCQRHHRRSPLSFIHHMLTLDDETVQVTRACPADGCSRRSAKRKQLHYSTLAPLRERCSPGVNQLPAVCAGNSFSFSLHERERSCRLGTKKIQHETSHH